jgi:hypothetical protein
LSRVNPTRPCHVRPQTRTCRHVPCWMRLPSSADSSIVTCVWRYNMVALAWRVLHDPRRGRAPPRERHVPFRMPSSVSRTPSILTCVLAPTAGVTLVIMAVPTIKWVVFQPYFPWGRRATLEALKPVPMSTFRALLDSLY